MYGGRPEYVLESQQQGDGGSAPRFRAPSVLLERALCTSVRLHRTRRWAWVLFPRKGSSLVRVPFVILRVLPTLSSRGPHCHLSLFLQGPVKGPCLSANALLPEPSVLSLWPAHPHRHRPWTCRLYVSRSGPGTLPAPRSHAWSRPGAPHPGLQTHVTICSTKVLGDKLRLSMGASWVVGDKQVHKCLAQAGRAPS